jgi:hypothetical protein
MTIVRASGSRSATVCIATLLAWVIVQNGPHEVTWTPLIVHATDDNRRSGDDCAPPPARSARVGRPQQFQWVPMWTHSQTYLSTQV